MVLVKDRGRWNHPGKWVLLDSKRKRVLRVFGKKKPSPREVQRQEEIIQYFKHKRKTSVKVKAHNRKGKRIKAHHRKVYKVVGQEGKINPKDREFFDFLARSKSDKEYGGYLDFGKKGKLQQASITLGDKESVDLDDDWEAIYHTHTKDAYLTPSPEDMSIFKKGGTRAQIIFQKGKAITLTRTKKAKLRKNIVKRFNKIYDELEKKHDSKKVIEKELIKSLRKEGFQVGVFGKKGKPITLRIIAKE